MSYKFYIAATTYTTSLYLIVASSVLLLTVGDYFNF